MPQLFYIQDYTLKLQILLQMELYVTAYCILLGLFPKRNAIKAFGLSDFMFSFGLFIWLNISL